MLERASGRGRRKPPPVSVGASYRSASLPQEGLRQIPPGDGFARDLPKLPDFAPDRFRGHAENLENQPTFSREQGRPVGEARLPIHAGLYSLAHLHSLFLRGHEDDIAEHLIAVHDSGPGQIRFARVYDELLHEQLFAALAAGGLNGRRVEVESEHFVFMVVFPPRQHDFGVEVRCGMSGSGMYSR